MAVTARASSFTLNLDRVFPSFQLTAPSSLVQPWLTATFTDVGTLGNDVLLTMTALNLTTNTARPLSGSAAGTAVPRPENVVDWWFNINPQLSAHGGFVGVAKLSITSVSGVQATSVNQAGGATGQNTIHPAQDGFYDFEFVFAPSIFIEGQNSVYELKGLLGQKIHASDFVGFFSGPDKTGTGLQNGTYESSSQMLRTKNPGA
jgi:hypothetical protein